MHTAEFATGFVDDALRNTVPSVLMTLAIKYIHNLPPHLSYVSILPDYTQKRKSYVDFL